MNDRVLVYESSLHYVIKLPCLKWFWMSLQVSLFDVQWHQNLTDKGRTTQSWWRLKVTTSFCGRVRAMARRSNMLAGAVLLAGLAALNSVSFVNPQPVERSSRMAMKGSAVEWVPKLSRDVVEVMFTAPAQGARSRMLIRADADVSEVIKQGRKKLGFDQDWMPDSDFKLYNAEDEDAGPLKGKMSENGLVDFSYEIHLYYEPQ